MWAKFRRLAYFVAESDKLHRSLVHDELRFYNLYNFQDFDTQNPLIIAEEPKTVQHDESPEQPLIAEAQATDDHKVSSDPIEATATSDKVTQDERIESFEVDYGKLVLPPLDMEALNLTS